MSDRFRELAEEEVKKYTTPGFSAYETQVQRMESALRKLADEIREEDAKIADIFDKLVADKIRSKKTKPPSEVEP